MRDSARLYWTESLLEVSLWRLRSVEFQKMIKHNKTGLLCPRGDAAALATQLNRVVRDPKLRQQLTLNAQELVHQEFFSSVDGER